MSFFYAQLALLIFAAIFARRWGGWPERAASIIFLLLMAVDQALHLFLSGSPDWRNPEIQHLILDFVVFILVAIIALKADRIWTTWLGSIQLVAICAQVARLLAVNMPPLVYSILAQAPTWGAIGLICLATIHQRKRQLASNST